MADRERVWMAHVLGTQPGDQVVVRQYAVLTRGEDLTEDPPTEVMTVADWRRRHAEFGCKSDGFPLNPRPGAGVPVERIDTGMNAAGGSHG